MLRQDMYARVLQSQGRQQTKVPEDEVIKSIMQKLSLQQVYKPSQATGDFKANAFRNVYANNTAESGGLSPT